MRIANAFKNIILTLAALFLMHSFAEAAGSVTVTYNNTDPRYIQTIEIEWESDPATGNVSGCTGCSIDVSGYILAVETIPDATDAPTNLYDVTLTQTD